MNITWFGQSCFRIETKEASILIDPYSKETGLRVPRIKDDIVLVTHHHEDHNNLEGLNPEAFVIDTPGEYERKGVHIRGIQSFHDNTGGSERGLNTIYIVTAEEMSVCHLGDLGQEKLTDKQVEDIGDIDVLIIPVGGTYTIDADAAAEVIGQIEPKIIIPMHYKIEGLKIALDSVDKFVKEIGLTPEKTDKLKISAKLLPVDETKLYILQ